MDQRVSIRRGETATTVFAEVAGDTVRFPADALPYTPHPGMGLAVDGRPVRVVTITKPFDPPGPKTIEFTLAPTN